VARAARSTAKASKPRFRLPSNLDLLVVTAAGLVTVIIGLAISLILIVIGSSSGVECSQGGAEGEHGGATSNIDSNAASEPDCGPTVQR
jgi:hypothetical protein